jgi:DNA mismatch repair protein MutS
LPGVQNYSVSVYETDKEVVFMKKIIRGWANKSYGIDVAKLAGIPMAILEKAKSNLNSLQNKNEEWDRNLWALGLELWAPVSDARFEKIKQFLEWFDLNAITPLQALQLLSKVKDAMEE